MAKKKTPKKRRAKPKTKLQLQGLPTLQALVEHLGLAGPNAWDALIIGDGSGQDWELGGGWGGVLIDRYSSNRKLVYGAMKPCTVTLAELFPYLQALAWYTARDGPGRRRKKEINATGRNMQIHIATDSLVVATCGMHPESRKAHRELWAAIDAYRASGYNITFHHVQREVIDLNILVDEVSRQARLGIEETYDRAINKLHDGYGIPEGVTIYDFSPDRHG